MQEVLMRWAPLPRPVEIYEGGAIQPRAATSVAVTRVASSDAAARRIERFIAYALDEDGEPLDFAQYDSLDEAYGGTRTTFGTVEHEWQICNVVLPQGWERVTPPST